MKKIICILTAIFILSISAFSVCATDEPVTSAGGNVTIDATITGLSEKTPVMVVILPENIDEVTTKAGLPTGTVAADIITALKSSTLDVEYFDVVLTGEGGSLYASAKMKSSLSTGNCYVFVKYLGSNDWEKLGMFEHVGQDDIDTLVGYFNGSASGYAAIIATDMSGNEILRKSGANVIYYQSLVDLVAANPTDTALDFTDDFCTVLAAKKPEGGFNITTLISAFNETCAWVKLRAEAGTMDVLNAYNGNYWELPLDAADDFTTLLNEDERARVLAAIKSGNHSDKTVLETTFQEELALSLFRLVSDRDSLADLIAEDNDYSSYFAEVRDVLASADVNEYEKLVIYDSVLALRANDTCTDFTVVKQLFEGAIETPDDDDEGGGAGNSPSHNGRPVSSTQGGIGPVGVPATGTSQGAAVTKPPFKDVATEHWAHSYINRLYEDGVINGVGNDKFAPADSVSRQDFVKILVGVLDTELSLSDSTFSDLSVGCYCEPYIMTAVEKGLISGYGDGRFGIGDNITREDAAVLMSRVLGEKAAGINNTTYGDAATISSYAKDAVNTVSSLGIFKGDDTGNFNPKASLSRAEACAILCRLEDIMKEG